jgi:hypothetical protein
LLREQQVYKRYHIHESVVQEAIKRTVNYSRLLAGVNFVPAIGLVECSIIPSNNRHLSNSLTKNRLPFWAKSGKTSTPFYTGTKSKPINVIVLMAAPAFQHFQH